MDISAIAAALSQFLAPLLPYLAKGAEKGAEAIGESLGEGAWDKAKEIWGKLHPRVEASPTANEAANDIAGSPDDEDARARLALGLKKILSGDPELATTLAQLMGAAAPKVSYDAHASDEGIIAQDRGVAAREVAVGRDVHGNVIILRVYAGPADVDRLLRQITQRAPDRDPTRHCPLPRVPGRPLPLPRLPRHGRLRPGTPATPAPRSLYPAERPCRYA
jgi:hypothetical protein